MSVADFQPGQPQEVQPPPAPPVEQPPVVDPATAETVIETKSGEKPVHISQDDIRRHFSNRVTKSLENLAAMPPAQRLTADPSTFIHNEGDAPIAPPAAAPPPPPPPPFLIDAPAEPEDPLDMAYKMTKHSNPVIQAHGREMLAKILSAGQPEAPPAPAAPNWDERLASIRHQVEEEKINKLSLRYRKEVFDENDPSVTKIVEEVDPTVNSPLFKEVVEMDARQRLRDEQFDYERKNEQERREHAETQRMEQDRQERQRIHNTQVQSVALTGYPIEGGSNTADWFKGPDGKVNQDRVESWEAMVNYITEKKPKELEAYIQRVVPPHILNGPQATEHVSAAVIRLAWGKFVQAYGQPQKQQDLTQTPKPSTDNPTQAKQTVPDNLLGRATPPNMRTETAGLPVKSHKSFASYVQNA